MSDDNVTVIEDQVERLLDDFGDLLADIDPGTADIGLVDAPLFEARMWAGQRMQLVRDANALRLAVIGNKIVNPEKSKELEKQFEAVKWQVAAIDKLHKDAKRLCSEIMEIAAYNEQEEHDRRLKSVRAKGK